MRSKSPLATCGTWYFSAIRRACVPLPAPTGPSRTRSSGLSANEAPVVAHDQLRFELTHRIERDADDDQHGGAGNRQRLETGGRLHEIGQDGDNAEEQRTRDGDADQHVEKVLVR